MRGSKRPSTDPPLFPADPELRLFNFSQLRPLLEGRPVADHAHRVIPNFGRELGVALPPEWLPEEGSA